MKTIMVTVGTRPEVIKLAPLVRSLRAAGNLRTLLLSTAQHREMLDQALGAFDLEPDIDLDIMRHDQGLAASTGRALQGMDRVLGETTPDFLLVQGDTNTVLAAALAAHYHRVPVGHVEAGLRTDDPYLPFPEEMNRRLTTRLTRLHFAPTPRAAENLRREGVEEERLSITGNTVIDALFWTAENHPHALPRPVRPLLEGGGRFILVTAHRRESLQRHLEGFALAMKDIVSACPGVEIVYPVHLNPRVKETVDRVLAGTEGVHLIEPVTYPEMVQLLRRCHLVLTDSGGIQEEAPSFGKPVLVMRKVTERPEAIEAGVARLAGVEREGIREAALELLDSEAEYARYARAVNPFGDGRACGRIVTRVSRFLGV